jgi:hypothetical protein
MVVAAVSELPDIDAIRARWRQPTGNYAGTDTAAAAWVVIAQLCSALEAARARIAELESEIDA